jgi:N-alpha-acetyltransferase 35, NatC auxiliary subunit
MDSKMDSGYLGPGENHAAALEDDYDVMRELRPEEVVGIMDQLLCHEVRLPSCMGECAP